MLCLFCISLVLDLAFAVPPLKHDLPRTWQDDWIVGLSDENLTISATAIMRGNDNLFVIELQTLLTQWSVILADGTKRCNVCYVMQELHPNIISLQSSECKSQVPPDMLCNQAISKQAQFLYRSKIRPGSVQCPPIFVKWGVSYNISYSELSLESGTWKKVKDCGAPRSELNSCVRRRQQDPQFSLTLGNCPETSLFHRQTLTQNLNCIGSFERSGLNFVVTKGSEYEFWEDGNYIAHEDIFRCFAFKAYSNEDFVRVAQGIGSDCNGISGELNLDTNAFRAMSLTRVHQEVSGCNFPDWVRSNSWKVIPRGGMRPQSREDEEAQKQVSFPDKNSFILSLQGSNGHGQKFKCANIVSATKDEVFVQTFTQSQCYGEFHCFHAKLTPDNFVEIHVGAPTPNIEHSCLKPSFDIDVPYLLATLVPQSLSISGAQLKPPRVQISTQTTNQEIQIGTEDQSENLEKIRRHALNLLQQYHNEYMTKVQTWVGNFVDQIKILFL